MQHDSKTQKSAVYEQVRHAILVMELAPGSALDEAELCARHGLSRTPLREVIQQLAGDGYVTLRPNRGAQVSEMSHKSLREFFLAAPMIYGAILKLAAENARPGDIARLKDAQVEFRRALSGEDVAGRAIANNLFHHITGEMADNKYLMPSFSRLLIDHARIGMTFNRPRSPDAAAKLSEAADQHDAIIAVIEAGEAPAAADLAIQHWNLSRGQIENFVMPRPLEAPLGNPTHSSGT